MKRKKKGRKKLTYKQRVAWFYQHFHETGIEYPALLESMKNEDLDNFNWYGDVIYIPKYVDEL